MNNLFAHKSKAALLSIFIIVALYGCTKDEDLDLGPGVDYLPYYSKNTYGFEGADAIRRYETEKNKAKMKELQAEENVEKIASDAIGRFGGGDDLLIADPWIPPATVTVDQLPPAMRGFPKDKYGYPDWVAAADSNLIEPKGSLYGDEPSTDPDYDEDIIFQINDKLMYNVRFPHKKHTYWLSCAVCHPGIFIDKKGANDINMYEIWNGNFCGRCHGKVAYQPKGFNNCQRCHSVQREGMGMGTN